VGRCANIGGKEGSIVDALVEKLDARLRAWKPETAAEARERIAELIARLERGRGILSSELMAKLNAALAFALELEPKPY
jgi:hypothetical protein